MFATPVYAQAAGAAAQGGGTMGGILSMAPLILIFVAFYFLMIRPQQRRVKELQNAVGGVKKGDEVVTAGGHIGRVTKVSDHEVEVEFGAGQKHRVVKSTLAEVRPLGGAKPAND
jgi:preprotein translocase subunit YajC